MKGKAKGEARIIISYFLAEKYGFLYEYKKAASGHAPGGY